MSDKERFVSSTTATIMSHISVPMNTKPFGGTHGGVLLGIRVRTKIEAAIAKALAEEFDEQGSPEPAYDGTDLARRIESGIP